MTTSFSLSLFPSSYFQHTLETEIIYNIYRLQHILYSAHYTTIYIQGIWIRVFPILFFFLEGAWKNVIGVAYQNVVPVLWHKRKKKKGSCCCCCCRRMNPKDSLCVCVCVCVCVSVCVSLSLARRSVSFDCCWAVPFPFGFRFVHHPSYGTVAVAVFIRCHGTDGWSRESRNELKFWNTSTASADATTTTTNMMRQTQTKKKCIPHTRTHEKSRDLIIFFILFFVWIWNRASRNVTLCELLELALTFLCYCCCCCCFPLPKQMMCVISWSFTHKPKMPLLFDRPCARAPIVVRVKGQHAKRKIPLEQNSHTNEK